MSQISDRLAEVRARSGLSLRAFVEALGVATRASVAHDSVRRYEASESRVPAEYLAAVCTAFDVSAEWLLLGIGPFRRRDPSHAERALLEVAAVVERAASLGGSGTLDPERAVAREWERFTRSLPPERADLLDPILQSWARSRSAGVDATEGPTVRRIPNDALRALETRNADLLAAAIPHLGWLSAACGDVPHVAYVVCREGIVLHAAASGATLLDDWALNPGCDWSEAQMGTNGAGTALATGRIAAVFGPEHYHRQFHGCTCMAAPVVDPTGAVSGAIDLSLPFSGWRPDRLVLVAYAAQMIARDLAGVPAPNPSGASLVGTFAGAPA